MAGNRAGGIQAAKTNKERHGENFYRDLAYKAQESWDKNGRKPRGFEKDRDLARRAGKRAGSISKRGYRFIRETEGGREYIASKTGNVVIFSYDSQSKKYERADR